MDAWVGQQAPLMAAALDVNEGKMWRELRARTRTLQEELSSLDVETALAEEVPEANHDPDAAA